MDRYNKKNILKTFTIIITFLFIFAEVNCDIIPLINLSAGDVINGIDLNNDSSEIVGKLFDDNMISKYVEKNNTLDNSWPLEANVIMVYDCDEMNNSNFYPEIKVINAMKKIANESYKLNRNFLSINESYVDKKYTCMERKTCEVKGRETVSKHLMNVNNIPEDVKQLANKTGVFEMRSEEKTYFVSSILKGYCLHQVRVSIAPEPKIGSFDLYEKNSVHIGRVSVANNNKTLETWINNYLNDAHQSLFNITWENRVIIFEQIKNATVIELELEQLPALPPQ